MVLGLGDVTNVVLKNETSWFRLYGFRFTILVFRLFRVKA